MAVSLVPLGFFDFSNGFEGSAASVGSGLAATPSSASFCKAFNLNSHQGWMSPARAMQSALHHAAKTHGILLISYTVVNRRISSDDSSY